MADVEEYQKMSACGRVFCPAAPINQVALFRGRKDQIHAVIAAITIRGKHVVMFGDRGVGKTSLANILKDLIAATDSIEVVKVNCNESDTYQDLWRRALDDVTVVVEKPTDTDHPGPVEFSISQWITPGQFLGSGDIKRLLNLKCCESHELILVFDEVDRLSADQRRFFADTIKDLSDSSTNATVILIGVAHTLTELIAEHLSIERCISQIYMPPMAKNELRDIIETGLRSLKMTIESEAKEVIVSLSRGYPYYTHLLCYEACCKAIRVRSEMIRRADLNDAIRIALKNAQASVCDSYTKAVEGQRKGTNFPSVLLACALAKSDELGCFRPTDLQWPGNTGKGSKFSEPLHKLATDETRGLVLERFGTERKYKFRFRNPLLKPYVIMKGITEGLVKGELLDGLGVDRPREGNLFDYIDLD